jgi:hypothetical protein
MLEYELKFPFESRLTLTLHEKSILSSTIGSTVIDLEDRLLAPCYATCGIPKNFDKNDINEWRDIKRPTEILKKLCKEYKITAKFDSDNLTVKTEDETKQYGGKSKVSGHEEEKFSRKNSKSDKYFEDERRAFEALNDWKALTKVN